MLQIIPASRRYQKDFGWLKTCWLFSFGDYFDPENLSWGALRVFNDDVIVSGGFPMHGHRDMEIVTLVLSGTLEHQDSLGHRGQVQAGEVQVMTAGSGIRHSERNPSDGQPVHLFQIWIQPRETGRQAGWKQKSFAERLQNERDTLLVCDERETAEGQGPLGIGQSARIHHLNLKAGESLNLQVTNLPWVFLYGIEGRATVNGQPFPAADQVRARGETGLEIRAETAFRALLIETVDAPEGS